MTSVPTTPLTTPSGTVDIPQLGFGVWQVDTGDAVPAVAKALEVGYRHVDTAAAYGNEEQVGRALAESDVDTADVFVTTKVWNDKHGFDQTLAAFDESVTKLGVETLDLYLIHWPAPANDAYVDTWKALQRLRDDGRVRAIGVCNFKVPHLQRLLDETGELPAINQIELHPHLVQQDMRDFHAEHGIVTEDWSPLASGGDVLTDPAIESIASHHGVTAAQAILRWHLQIGSVVIPKSITPSRIEENFDVFGFELRDEDVAAITALDKQFRTGPDPDVFNVGA